MYLSTVFHGLSLPGRIFRFSQKLLFLLENSSSARKTSGAAALPWHVSGLNPRFFLGGGGREIGSNVGKTFQHDI